MNKVIEQIGRVFEKVSRRRMWTVLYLFSLMSLVDIILSRNFALPFWYAWIFFMSFASLKSTVLLGLVILINRCRKLHWLAWIIVIGYCLLSAINGACYAIYGFGISKRLMSVLIQTSASEIKGFLPGLIHNIVTALSSIRFWAIVFIGLIAFHYLPKLKSKIFAIIALSLTILGIICGSIFAVRQSEGRSALFLSTRILRYGYIVHRSMQFMAEGEMHYRELPDADKVRSSHLVTNVIVVIGESASRDHLRLYGYKLPTTPALSAMRDSLFVFTNAIGSSTSTSGNMDCLLTFKSDRDVSKEWYEFPAVIDLFNAAGYKTYWFSNQEKYSLFNNSSTIMSRRATLEKYLIGGSEDFNNNADDAMLLPLLSKSLNDNSTNRMIFVHLIGSHTPYHTRYPEDHAVFSASDIKRLLPRRWLTDASAKMIAEYDNSIVYTDYILKKMIDIVRYTPASTILIYLSDHGENVFDDRDYVGRDNLFVEVPFVIYANQRAYQKTPELMEKFNLNLDKPFTTANLIYALMTMTGTKYSMYDSTKDILSDTYIPRKRFVDGEISVIDNDNK